MVKILRARLINKGVVIAALDLDFPELGLEIRDCLVFRNRDGGKYLRMPSAPFEKDGKTKYKAFVRFTGEGVDQAIQEEVLTAFEVMHRVDSGLPKDEPEDDLPF